MVFKKARGGRAVFQLYPETPQQVNQLKTENLIYQSIQLFLPR
jgi:hypothetical protein